MYESLTITSVVLIDDWLTSDIKDLWRPPFFSALNLANNAKLKDLPLEVTKPKICQESWLLVNTSSPAVVTILVVNDLVATIGSGNDVGLTLECL